MHISYDNHISCIFVNCQIYAGYDLKRLLRFVNAQGKNTLVNSCILFFPIYIFFINFKESKWIQFGRTIRKRCTIYNVLTGYGEFLTSTND